MADWRDDKTLPECMMYMLENEIMCDVTLRVGKNQIPIKAHKYMLSSRSPVFHTMFEGSMPERGEIKIPDIDEKACRDLLRYIYSDKMDITNENVKEMLYAADKYMLSAMKKECGNILKISATTEHAAKVLQTAYQFHLSDLQEESLVYIENNAKKCLLSEHSLSLPKECLELVLKSDYLDCSETDLCTFFIKWAKAQCESSNIEATGQNMRNQAGHLLYLVRFPAVQMDYFSTEIVESGLLTVDEIAAIYQTHFGVKKEPFMNNDRCPVKNRQVITALRSDQIYSYWTSSGVDVLFFTSDTNIWLKGIVVCCPYQDYVTETFTVRLKVTDEEDKEMESYYQEFYDFNSYELTLDIYFPEPTRILRGKKYTLRMDDGMNYQWYYCTNAKSSVSTNGVTITFDNSPLNTSGTDKDQGQFAGILFSI